MISIINDQYVVQLPEHGIYQNIDPATGNPFVSEAAAQAWVTAFLARIDADVAAQVAMEKQRLASTLCVVATSDKVRTKLGDPITLTALVKNALGDVVALSESFAVPIENERGEVILIKLAEFVDGHATVVFVPPRSGYYCITEAGINRKLPPDVYFGLPLPLEIVVYE